MTVTPIACSGVIWHADGLIVTNAHLVRHAESPRAGSLALGHSPLSSECISSTDLGRHSRAQTWTWLLRL